jgi:hypothetical protein
MPVSAVLVLIGTAIIVACVAVNFPRILRQARSDPSQPAGAPPLIWIGLAAGLSLEVSAAIFLLSGR